MINIAHIHPMVVHFPIVLFLFGVALMFIVMVRGGDLAEHTHLAQTALVTVLLGTLGAVAAAVFGDMALDKAVDLGFPKKPLEEHAGLGMTTMSLFILLSAVYLFAWWRRISLAGAKGWAMFAFGLIGVAVLIAAAYHGGDLVYQLGVNVARVKP